MRGGPAAGARPKPDPAWAGLHRELHRPDQMVEKFARKARQPIRIEGRGYRRDHFRALAQRAEVADREVRIIGSKSNLLQTLTAASGAKPASLAARAGVI